MLSKFSLHGWVKGWYWKPVPWNAELEKWLTLVEADDDLELTRRLWTWKLLSQVKFNYRKLGKLAHQQIRQRLHKGMTATQVRAELAKWQGHGVLDEDFALFLWDFGLGARDYLKRHLPWSSKTFWQKFFERAKEEEPELAWLVYRRLVSKERWEKDLDELARTVAPPPLLHQELVRRTPDYGFDLGPGLIKLLEQRGKDAFPFVISQLRRIWKPLFGRGSFGKLVSLCAQREWWELWGATLRICSPVKEFNREVRNSLGHPLKLASLAGLSREWDFGPFGLVQVQILDTDTALALYAHDPELLRGLFKSNLQVRASGHLPLLKHLVAQNEHELVDFLASRYLVQMQPCAEQDYLADYYAGQKEGAQFARRAANALGKLPAYSIWNYNQLLEKNRLARLLFQRSAESFSDSFTDLVEASEIHVMALGYRCLARATPAQAAAHLTLLEGTLLRPLQRDTRKLALQALARAAQHSLETAQSILKKARAALRLPEQHYPKEHLLELIGGLLHRYPQLRSEREQVKVYRRV